MQAMRNLSRRVLLATTDVLRHIVWHWYVALCHFEKTHPLKG